MKIRNTILMFLLTTSLALAACGGGGGGGGGGSTSTGGGGGTPPTWVGVPVTYPSVANAASNAFQAPITSYTQNIPRDTNFPGLYPEVFPGEANVWSLDVDLDIENGGGNQFWAAVDLALCANASCTPHASQYAFPDCDYTLLTPYSPLLQSVQTVTVGEGQTMGTDPVSGLSFPALVEQIYQDQLVYPITDTYAAFLNPTSNSILQQTIDLSGVSKGTQLELDWAQDVSLDQGDWVDNGYDPPYQWKVYLYSSLTGTVDITPGVDQSTATPPNAPSPGSPYNRSYDLPNSLDGQQVILTFEYNSAIASFSILPPPPTPESTTYAIVAAVSVHPTNNITPNYVVNGDFKTGDLTGWTTNTPAEVQNITTQQQDIQGLTVTRSFYTAPNNMWGRWVDLFVNNTSSQITTTVNYETNLDYNYGGPGELTYFVSYYPTGLYNNAITAWDAVDGSRDIGWVFGNAASVASAATSTFQSYAVTYNQTGAGAINNIEVYFPITVPPNGSVAIVNFIIMDGTATGDSCLSGENFPLCLVYQASAIDAEAATIVNNVCTDTQYLTGMTEQQAASIVNFSCP